MWDVAKKNDVSFYTLIHTNIDLINKAFISNIVETSPNSKQCVIAVNDIHIKINESFDELKLQVYGRV